MSKFLSVASVIEKNRLSSENPYLVLLDIEVVNPKTGVVVEVMHIARNSEDITFQSELYSAGSFEIDMKQQAGSQDELTLRVKDLSRAIQSRMQEYGGGIGFNVTVYVVNAGNLTQAPEIVEYFQVIGASAAEYAAEFRLGAENALSITFPRRRQTKDFCQWRYKDPDTCGYAGDMISCDLTLQGPNGCGAHGNSLNFGAFPGINTNGMRYG